MTSKVWDEITYPIPKFQRWYTPHFIIDLIF